MKKFILILSLFSFFASASVAQTNDSYKKTLRTMLDVAGTQATFQAAIKQMFTMFKQQRQQVPAEVWNSFETEFSKASLDELVDRLVPVYQKHFTEADLNGFISFYRTPIGRKLAEKSPLVMQESMAVGQQWGLEIAKSFEEKMKAKGY